MSDAADALPENAEERRRASHAWAYRVAQLLYRDLKKYADRLGAPNNVARHSSTGTGLRHALWMCEQLIDESRSWDEGKMWRWVGYLQGMAVARAWSTLDLERSRVGMTAPRDAVVVTNT